MFVHIFLKARVFVHIFLKARVFVHIFLKARVFVLIFKFKLECLLTPSVSLFALTSNIILGLN